MTEKKQKPVTVKIEDFRESLNKSVTESELPPFLLEILLREYLAGISRVAWREYAEDREEWEKKCAAEKSKEILGMEAEKTRVMAERARINVDNTVRKANGESEQDG